MIAIPSDFKMQLQRVGREWRWTCPRTGATGTSKTKESAMRQGERYVSALFGVEVARGKVTDLRRGAQGNPKP